MSLFRFSLRRAVHKRRRVSKGRPLSVEPLEARRMLSVVSDAPPDYPSIVVTGNSGPILGATRTTDDGVAFSLLRVGQLGATVTATVANGSNARLDGWIDFNRDESFGGPDEQIFDSVPIGTGANQTLRFDIPSWAEEGGTYARFRIATALSPDDGLGHAGNQSNGEVEDYAIELLPPRAGSGDFDNARIVTQGGIPPNGPVDVLTGNFNRFRNLPNDTSMEIVSSSHIDGKITLYRANASFTDWDPHVIYNGADNPNAADPRAIGLASGDFDGDGDLDLVSASANDDTVAWYRNDSTPSNWSFTRVVLATGVSGARAVTVADFDRDGRLDVATVSLEDSLVRLFRNTGNGDGALMFAPPVVAVDVSAIIPGASTLEGLADIVTGDFDGDGFVDFATVEAITNRVVWYRNDSNPFTGMWAPTQVLFNGTDTAQPNAAGIFSVDMDGDGDLDLLSTFRSEGRVDWFANNGAGSFSSTRSAVASGLNAPYPAYAADIDGDGDMDVLLSNSGGNQLVWRENTGSGSFVSGDIVAFTTPTNVAISDIDGDGALDILAGSDTTDQIGWWQNPYLPPDITVRGGGQIISDGDTIPRNLDGTLFGSAPLGGTPIVKTFAIHNTGAGVLNVYSVLLPAGFTLITDPTGTVSPDGQTSFMVRLDTTVAGVKSGDVVILNDDGTENVYNFRVEGTVVAPLAGDYNDDGVVNTADYIVWRNTLGSTTDLRANGDDTGASQGVIDAADYLVWKNNFGATEDASLAANGGESVPQASYSLPMARPAREAVPFRPAVRTEIVQGRASSELLLLRDATAPNRQLPAVAEMRDSETRVPPPARELWKALADEVLAGW